MKYILVLLTTALIGCKDAQIDAQNDTPNVIEDPATDTLTCDFTNTQSKTAVQDESGVDLIDGNSKNVGEIMYEDPTFYVAREGISLIIEKVSGRVLNETMVVYNDGCRQAIGGRMQLVPTGYWDKRLFFLVDNEWYAHLGNGQTKTGTFSVKIDGTCTKCQGTFDNYFEYMKLHVVADKIYQLPWQ